MDRFKQIRLNTWHNAKLELSTPNDTGLPLCDVPRCLIEFTPEQSSEVNDSRALAMDEHTQALRQQTKENRIRYLGSRSDLEKVPLDCLIVKRGPTQGFKRWADKYGFDE